MIKNNNNSKHTKNKTIDNNVKNLVFVTIFSTPVCDAGNISI